MNAAFSLVQTSLELKVRFFLAIQRKALRNQAEASSGGSRDFDYGENLHQGTPCEEYYMFCGVMEELHLGEEVERNVPSGRV